MAHAARLESSVRVLFLTAALLTVEGCAGTLVVDFSLAGRLEGPGFGDPIATRSTSNFEVSPAEAPGSSLLSSLKLSTDLFEWTIGTSTMGFGGSIRNLSTEPICFGFDRASVATNFSPEVLPLRVYHSAWLESGHWKLKGDTRFDSRKPFVPDRVCIASHESRRFSLSPVLLGLFPSQKMFDVEWQEGARNLSRDGIGNWLALKIPIEYAAQEVVLDLRVTATASRTRISYH